MYEACKLLIDGGFEMDTVSRHGTDGSVDGSVQSEMNESLTAETLYFSSVASVNWWTVGPFSEQKES